MDFLGIREKGNFPKERIVFKATIDIDLGYYLVFIVKNIDDKNFSSTPEQVFWFPDKKVKAGDLVIVYTKSGNNTFKNNASSNTSHFFYWGLDNSPFLDEQNIPLLVETKGWDAFLKQK